MRWEECKERLKAAISDLEIALRSTVAMPEEERLEWYLSYIVRFIHDERIQRYRQMGKKIGVIRNVKRGLAAELAGLNEDCEDPDVVLKYAAEQLHAWRWEIKEAMESEVTGNGNSNDG